MAPLLKRNMLPHFLLPLHELPQLSVVPVAIVFKLRFPEPIGWYSVLSPIIAQDVSKDYPNGYIPEKKKVPGLFNYAEMDTEY